MEDLLPSLVGTAPAAVAVIIVVWMFLRRLRESEGVGIAAGRERHDNHQETLRVFRESLKEVIEAHGRTFEKIGDKLDRSATKQEESTRSLDKLITLVEHRTNGGRRTE